jgi:hypothetical protein
MEKLDSPIAGYVRTGPFPNRFSQNEAVVALHQTEERLVKRREHIGPSLASPSDDNGSKALRSPGVAHARR